MATKFRFRARHGLALSALFAAATSLAQVPGQIPEAPPAPKFSIERFLVEGNTILTQAEIEAAVAPFAGPNRDFGNVQQALEALQDVYLEKGFNAVRVLVPEQDLVSGRVRLQVIEARIRNIRIEDNRHFDEANIRASLPALVRGEPPNTRRLSENVQLVNENPAKQVTVQLQALDQPGQADAVVRVTDFDPERISISLDNTGNPLTGNFRLGLGYQNANVGGRDHVFTAQYITSPTKPKEVSIFGLGYRIPIYRWNGSVEAFYGYSDVNSGTVQDLFSVSGSGTVMGARYNQVLPRFGAYEHKLTAGLDYRDFKQNVNLIGVAGTLVPDLVVRPWSLTYSGRLAEVGNDLSFFGSFVQNLPGGADGSQGAFTAQRAGAPARYYLWRAGTAWSRALEGDFLFRASVNMQYTREPLVPGEQFGMGGQDSVRGFYEREASSDAGYRLSGELYGPDVGESFSPGWRVRFLGFYDTAKGWDKAPQRVGEQSISSLGLGVRVSQGRQMSLRIDWAHVLETSITRPDNRNRVHFTFVYAL